MALFQACPLEDSFPRQRRIETSIRVPEMCFEVIDLDQTPRSSIHVLGVSQGLRFRLSSTRSSNFRHATD